MMTVSDELPGTDLNTYCMIDFSTQVDVNMSVCTYMSMCVSV